LTTLRYRDSFDVVKQIILRSVPDELHRRLKIMAAEKGTTLQGQILRILEKEVAKAARKG
jgi:plasmid stability protein